MGGCDLWVVSKVGDPTKPKGRFPRWFSLEEEPQKDNVGLDAQREATGHVHSQVPVWDSDNITTRDRRKMDQPKSIPGQ